MENNRVLNFGNELIGYSYDVLDYIRKNYVNALNGLSCNDCNYLRGLLDNDLEIMYKLSIMNDLVKIVYTDQSYELYVLTEKEV